MKKLLLILLITLSYLSTMGQGTSPINPKQVNQASHYKEPTTGRLWIFSAPLNEWWVIPDSTLIRYYAGSSRDSIGFTTNFKNLGTSTNAVIDLADSVFIKRFLDIGVSKRITIDPTSRTSDTHQPLVNFIADSLGTDIDMQFLAKRFTFNHGTIRYANVHYLDTWATDRFSVPDRYYNDSVYKPRDTTGFTPDTIVAAHNGRTYKVPYTGGGGGNTIYTGDGDLAGNRSVRLNNHYLVIRDTTNTKTQFYMNPTGKNIQFQTGDVVSGWNSGIQAGDVTFGGLLLYYDDGTHTNQISVDTSIVVKDEIRHHGLTADSLTVYPLLWDKWDYITKGYADSLFATIPGYTFGNGLTNTSNTITWGGTLTQGVLVTGSSSNTITFAGTDLLVNSLTIGRGNGYHTSNTAVGINVLSSRTTGTANTGVGLSALQALTSGSQNTSIGTSSLQGLTSGSNNVVVGSLVMNGATTATANTAVGRQSLFANLTGNQNTAIGEEAGNTAVGSGNVFIGYQSGALETGSNKLYIANSNTTTPLIGGDFSAETVTIGGSLGSQTALGTAGTDSVVVKHGGVYRAISPSYYGTGGGGITALTGDVTASGTGSVAATLATVNSNVGSFTNANITVNAKGLITAASNGAGLTSSNFITAEIPSGSINSSNTAYTLANTPTTGTVKIYRNGLRQIVGTDYTISGTSITYLYAPSTGDSLIADYLK